MSVLSIGEVARRSGLRASAIRYYERVGVLAAPTRVSGRRRYSSEVLDRLAVIQFARFAGFTLPEIRQLFHGFKDGTTASIRWQKLAARKVRELDQLIAHASSIKSLLETQLQCGCQSLAECGRIIRERARAAKVTKSSL